MSIMSVSIKTEKHTTATTDAANGWGSASHKYRETTEDSAAARPSIPKLRTVRKPTMIKL